MKLMIDPPYSSLHCLYHFRNRCERKLDCGHVHEDWYEHAHGAGDLRHAKSLKDLVASSIVFRKRTNSMTRNGEALITWSSPSRHVFRGSFPSVC